MARTAQAAEIVNVGDHVLLPNTPSQEIDVFVTNDRATPVYFQGLSFYAQVADGAPALGALEGSDALIIGPGITATIDTPPELFGTDNTGVRDGNPGQVAGKQLISLDISTDPAIGTGYIAQAGLSTVLLGKIFVDTTGFFSGSWSFAMNNTVIGHSNLIAFGSFSSPFLVSDPTGQRITDSTISVPEPTSLVLGLLAAAGLGIVAIRKRRIRRPIQFERAFCCAPPSTTDLRHYLCLIAKHG